MAEERDPVFRWIGEHPGWMAVITVLLVLCVAATVVGFAFLLVDGDLGGAPHATPSH